MSGLFHKFMVRTIREEKDRQPDRFPDYVSDDAPQIVNETEFDKIMFEAFDGQPVEPDKLRAMMKAVKALMEVKEITAGTERGPAPVLARIEPGIDPKAEARRMIDSDEIREIERRTQPRKRKA